MSILVDEHTRVLVQGITGRIGRIQTEWMMKAGTKIVAGVTPGKGGLKVLDRPVYDSVREAVAEQRIDASILFVPAASAQQSCLEALEAGVPILIVVTEHIPVHDTMRIRVQVRRSKALMIGPTTPGIISPGKSKIGIMPAVFLPPGPVGLISRSGTLSYEIAGRLSAVGFGQSTVVGLGADPVVGTDLIELLKLFEEDPETRVVVWWRGSGRITGRKGRGFYAWHDQAGGGLYRRTIGSSGSQDGPCRGDRHPWIGGRGYQNKNSERTWGSGGGQSGGRYLGW